MKYTIAALAATTLAASAATTVVSTTRGGTGDQAGFGNNSGQTFTSGTLGTDTTLGSVDLVGPWTANAETEAVGPFTVKIWLDTDGDAMTWDPGALVGASTNTIIVTGGDPVLTAFFAGGTLLDDTVYALSFTTGDGDHQAFRMGLTADDNPLGSDGKLFDAGGDPGFGDNRELAFTVNAVPEPSSTALLGLGGLALLMRRRK